MISPESQPERAADSRSGHPPPATRRRRAELDEDINALLRPDWPRRPSSRPATRPRSSTSPRLYHPGVRRMSVQGRSDHHGRGQDHGDFQLLPQDRPGEPRPRPAHAGRLHPLHREPQRPARPGAAPARILPAVRAAGPQPRQVGAGGSPRREEYTHPGATGRRAGHLPGVRVLPGRAVHRVWMWANLKARMASESCPIGKW